MKELQFNVGMVCKEHAPKAGKFKSREPHTFLGLKVKLAFPVNHPDNGRATKEHMWVNVTSLVPRESDGGNQLIGTLVNTPYLLCDFEYGDTVSFKTKEIEDVFAE